MVGGSGTLDRKPCFLLLYYIPVTLKRITCYKGSAEDLINPLLNRGDIMFGKLIQILVCAIFLLANNGCDTDYFTTEHAGQINCFADSDSPAYTQSITVKLQQQTRNTLLNSSKTFYTGYTIDFVAYGWTENFTGTIANGILTATHNATKAGEADMQHTMTDLTLTRTLLDHFRVGGQGGIPFVGITQTTGTQPCELEIF